MLFHVEQVHTPENCPYGRGGSRSLIDEGVAGVTLVAAYGAFMQHTMYLVVETDDFEKLNAFLLPGMKVCTTTITPVGDHPLPSATS